MLPKVYEPSGNKYYYMADFSSASIGYSELEKKALKSRNKDETYPGQYCDTVVYGGVEIAVDSVLTTDPRSAIAQFMSVGEFDSATVNLARPCSEAFNSATKLINNMEFGQPVGDDVPSKLMLDLPISGGVNFKWYKNGVLVATDSIINMGGQIAIAVIYSGNTIQNYAYVYTYNNEIWTSGVRGNSAVIQILNEGGFAGSDENKYGWSDEDFGDFMLSKIFAWNGTDTYDSYCGFANTVAGTSAKIQTECDNFGGYLGSEFIKYLTGKDDYQEAWDYLYTDSSSDGLAFSIPTSDEHTYQIKWDYTNKYFKGNLDGVDLGYISPVNMVHNSNGRVYITWYRQSQSVNNATELCMVILCSISGGYQYNFYRFAGGLDYDIDTFEPENAEKDAIDGYDPDKGQNDDPQEDPEDNEDPEYDPLASGFLYAFMVSGEDMEHLADCLVADTLAEKIRADFGNSLYDFIVSYHMMPCLTNADSLNKTNIAYRGQPFVYGENDTQLALAPITQTWYSVSCGTKVCMPAGVRRQDGFENWSNAQVQLYLPFIGYVHLNTADVWGEPITIVYRFDILQGTCVANVGVGNKGTIYSYEGSCKYTIPFTESIDKANQELLSGIFSGMGTAVSIGGAVATGSPVGLVGAMGGVADSVGHFMSALEHKSIINRGGSLSGTPGWLMPRTPALIITVPDVVAQGTIYNDINGYPCCKSDVLNSYGGFYVEVGQIDLKSIPNGDGASPNDTELDMIRTQLKEGVYV